MIRFLGAIYGGHEDGAHVWRGAVSDGTACARGRGRTPAGAIADATTNFMNGPTRVALNTVTASEQPPRPLAYVCTTSVLQHQGREWFEVLFWSDIGADAISVEMPDGRIGVPLLTSDCSVVNARGRVWLAEREIGNATV